MNIFKFSLLLLCGANVGFTMDNDNPYNMSEEDLNAYAIHISEHLHDPMDQFDFLLLQNSIREDERAQQERQNTAASEAFIRHLQQEDANRVHQEEINASEDLIRRIQQEDAVQEQRQNEARAHRLREEESARIQREQIRAQAEEKRRLAPRITTRAERVEIALLHRIAVLETHGHPASEASNWRDFVTSDPYDTQHLIQTYARSKMNDAARAAAIDTLTPIFAENAPYERRTLENEHFYNNPQSIHQLDDFYNRTHGNVLDALQRLNLGTNTDGHLIHQDEAIQIVREILLSYNAVDAGTLEASLGILFNNFSSADTELTIRMITMARDLEERGSTRVIAALLRIPENIALQGGCLEGRRNRNLLATLAILRDLGLCR